jgi:hypothetical protein
MKKNINIHSKGNTMAKPSTGGGPANDILFGKVRTGDRRPILHKENWYNFLAEDKAV